VLQCYTMQIRELPIQVTEQGLSPCLVPPILLQISLCKKKIPCHIKMSANAWSTKCWWNQKLIAQFCCTLWDEHFKPVSQNLDNFYQIQTKCYRNSDTVFFSPIHRTKRGLNRKKGKENLTLKLRRNWRRAPASPLGWHEPAVADRLAGGGFCRRQTRWLEQPPRELSELADGDVMGGEEIL
jgi:hypothetical protein